MIKEKLMSLEEIKKEIMCGCGLIGYVEIGDKFVNNKILSDKEIRHIRQIDSNVVLINFRTIYNITYLRYPNGSTLRVRLSKKKQKEITLKMWLCTDNKRRLPELSELICKWILVAKLLGKINNVDVICEIRRFNYVNDLFNMEYLKSTKYQIFEYERMKNKTDILSIIKDVKHTLGVKNGDMKCVQKVWEEYNADRLFVGDMKIYAEAYAAFYRTHMWVTSPSLYTQDIISNSRVYDDFVSYLYEAYKYYKHPNVNTWIKHESGIKNTMSYKMKYQEFLERIVVDYIKSISSQGEVERKPIDVLIDYDNLLGNHLDKVKTEGARLVIENDKVKVADYNSPINFKKFSNTILPDIARKLCIGYTTK